MISDEAKKLIENNPVAISTCSMDKPNISVAAYVKVLPDEKLLITDNYMTTTVSNLHKNGKVELAVWGDDWIGYKISGKAAYEDAGKWLDYARNITENQGLPVKGAILVTIDNIKRIGD